ncbi:MAG: immunoglobulin-like domain-containing protein [Pyrinomonadaceae bacterium]
MPPSRSIRVALFCMALALLAAGALFHLSQPAAAQKQLRPVRQESSESARPDVVVTVNFAELAAPTAAAAKRSARAAAQSVEEGEAAPAPLTINDSTGEPAVVGSEAKGGPGAADNASGPVALAATSPAPASSFLGQEDGPKVGTGTFTIPPDTMGAVGLDRVLTHVNNNYRVHNKTTGAALSTVSINTFWASTGATGTFDPRVQYDPYNNRWLVAATSNAQTANSSVLVGISNTADPLGTWTLYRFIVGCTNSVATPCPGNRWADFPMLGFNKTFVAVAWNEFSNAGAFQRGRFVELDYAQMLAGSASPTAGIFNIGGAFCMNPAETYSATEPNLYFVVHLSSAGATYVVLTLSGTPAAPLLAIGATQVRPGGGWLQPGGDIVPQKCDPLMGCPATLRRLNAGDSFIRSNVVFRNGRLYYAQTVGLRQATTGPITHTAAQWTAVNATTHAFVQGGRVEDPAATATNGGKWYTYPSIAVNKNDDVLLGFSVASSDDYISAGYAYHDHTDAAGTMQDPVVYKPGEDYYDKTFSGTENRWGDYSHTVVDPSDDRSLWTIQEYAGTRTVPGVFVQNNSRWGTWWAKVSPNKAPMAAAGADQSAECSAGSASFTLDGSGSSDPDGDALTYEWREGATLLGTGSPLVVTLPQGSHTITLTVTDTYGATATDTVVLDVVDTTNPVVTLNGSSEVFVECGAGYTDAGATANDSCNGSLTPVKTFDNVNPSLPGTYQVTYTATDVAGNSASATRTVHVVDTTAPIITGVSASPDSLWPPNHKMVEVTVNYTAFDACCLVSTQLSAVSSEPDNGLGDGDTAGDIEIVDAHHVRLRAERSGKGNGRTYTITITAADCAGHVTTQTVTVKVPKSQGK